MSLQHAPALSQERLAAQGFWLSVWLAWLTLPHAGQIPPLCLGVALTLLGLHAAHSHWRQRPWPRWVLLVALLGVYAATASSHSTLWSKEAGVSMVVMLAALKNLEIRHRRDLFVGVLAGLLLLLTHFLQVPSFGLTVMLAVGVSGLLGCLVRLSNPVRDPGPWVAMGLTAKLVLWGAPIMVLMFFMFPRVGPLWGQSVPMPYSAAGLNDRLKLGDIAQVAQDDRPALRLRWRQGADTDPAWLYLRGPVLSLFDGVQWTSEPDLPTLPPPPQTDAASEGALDYDIVLEPSTLSSVPTVATTYALWTDHGWPLQGRQDGSWVSKQALVQPLQLHARGQRGPLPATSLSPQERTQLLHVPAHSNPRTVAWARAQPWGNAAAQAPAVVQSLLRQVTQKGFRYTLSGLNHTGAPPELAIDAFWLDTREGYCEHFAAAFALILRSVGIPARIVTGYQGAEVQTLDGLWLVRQQRAHAWVEYWHPPKGWVSVDPTTAMRPEQISREPGMRLPPGLQALEASPDTLPLWRSWQRGREWLAHQWRMQVLGYDSPQQMQWLRSLGWSTPSTEHALGTIGLGLAVLLALWGAGQWVWRPRTDAWQHLLAQSRQALAQAGLAPAPHTPPRTLAELALSRWGEQAHDVAQALRALDHWRYGRPSPSGAQAPTFKALRRTLRQAIERLPRRPQG